MSQSTSHTVLEQITAGLPNTWHEPVRTLAEATLLTDTPLQLILLGAFSVGKSSLLNMLLQEPLLQTAMEETTALPTFIEYGTERAMTLVGPDGSSLPLDELGFAHATTHAPEGAVCAVVNLPQPWLQGISIIDLPGLGSVSNAHRDYTLAQIRQADVVLYLLHPSGPSQLDVETLGLIQQAGKRVKVMVSRWDEVDAAAARGEKTPSLEQWANQIEQTCGLRTRLAPCHRDGLGRDEIIDFVQRAREDLRHIRERRFLAELKPILQNALGLNAEQQRSCAVESEAQAQAWHQTLMERKRQLSDFKAGVYGEQQADKARMQQQCSSVLQAEQQQLARLLQQLADALRQESEWEQFGQQGKVLLGNATAKTAKALSAASASYGTLRLPETQLAEFNLRLPTPETISEEDFLDMGKLSQLQQTLTTHQQELATLEQKLAALPEHDMSETEQALHELRQQRQTIASQPLPKVIENISTGNGAMIGRMLGEVADVALMFVNPTVAGAKVASLVGKGAKVANLAVNTAKVANTVKTGVKVAQLGQKGPGLLSPPIAAKLGKLEMLSAGYWGERIGGLLGGGPQQIEVVDPQALAAQQATLQELDQQTQQLKRALARNEDLVNERHLTGWALEQNQKEQARLQAELVRLKNQAEQKHREAQRAQQEERQRQLRHHAERAVAQWLRSFEQQTAAMQELMHAQIKSYWEDRVMALVNERLQDIEQLQAQSQASAEAKATALKQLRAEAQALQNTLATLA